MDSNSLTMLIVLIICICFSSLFSATETAFSSMNRIRMKSWAEEGDRKAKRTLELAEEFDKLLSSILIGNNLVNIGASTIATVLFVRSWPQYGAVMSTAVITLVVLIFGEISPKSLARERPERFAMAITPFVRLLMWIFTPLTFLFAGWQQLLSSLFHLSGQDGITEEELITMVEQAETEGGLDEDESDLIRNAIEFNDREVDEIYVHRVDITAAEDTITLPELADLFDRTGFSRIPIYHENMDNIIGIVLEKDLHRAMHKGEEELKAVLSQVLFTATTTKISDLLRQLQKEKCHLAIVVDEYGGTDGLATLEDILEELVGEIWDEHDEVIVEFADQPDGSCLVTGSAGLDDLFERYDLDDRDLDYTTVSGWVLAQLGRVPMVGDGFVYQNLAVTVNRVENRRILELRVQRIPADPTEV